MIRLYTVKTSRTGTIRKLLAGFVVGVLLTAAAAFYLHETRACMTDAAISKCMKEGC